MSSMKLVLFFVLWLLPMLLSVLYTSFLFHKILGLVNTEVQELDILTQFCIRTQKMTELNAAMISGNSLEVARLAKELNLKIDGPNDEDPDLH